MWNYIEENYTVLYYNRKYRALGRIVAQSCQFPINFKY